MNESLITFLYELANFVVFALLFGWIFIKPIRRLLDAQAAKDAKAEETAKQHLAEAQQLRQQLVDERDRFVQEMEHQRQAALSEARLESAKLLSNAKSSIARQRDELAQHAIQIQHRQHEELVQTVVHATRLAVASLLQKIDGPDLEHSLLESACQQLSQNKLIHDSQITIESAYELNGNHRKRIAAALGLTSPNGHVEFRVVDELLGGVRIKSSSGLIDHSIAGLSSSIEQNMRQALTSEDQ